MRRPRTELFHLRWHGVDGGSGGQWRPHPSISNIGGRQVWLRPSARRSLVSLRRWIVQSEVLDPDRPTGVTPDGARAIWGLASDDPRGRSATAADPALMTDSRGRGRRVHARAPLAAWSLTSPYGVANNPNSQALRIFGPADISLKHRCEQHRSARWVFDHRPVHQRRLRSVRQRIMAVGNSGVIVRYDGTS